MALQLSQKGKDKDRYRGEDPTKSLTRALQRFQDVLSPEQQKEFQSVSAVPDAAGVWFFVAKLDAENSSKTRTSISPRLCTFLSATQQFAGAVETFVSSNPKIAALVWGGIKTAIVIASNVASYFDKVTNMIMQIGRFCPTFEQFGKLYHGCTGLQQALCDYYAVIVDICVKIVEVSRRTIAKQIISSVLSPFESDFEPFLDRLKIAIKDITLQASLASKQADDEAKKLLEYESKENASFRPSAFAFFRKAAAQAEETREWQLNHTKRETSSLKIEIRQNLSSVDHIEPWKRFLKRRVRLTAEWLTQEPAFVDWKGSPGTATLWCSGTMGMGKTVLMSNVISQLRSSCLKNESIAHFFCLAENESSLTARNIIGSISRQLLDSLIEQSEYEYLLGIQNETRYLDTSETVKFLLARFVPGWTYYIVLDGLDECNPTQIRALDSAISALTKSPVANVKILCTGRPDLEEDLFGRTRPQYRVLIDEEKLRLDIDRYILTSLDDCLDRKLLHLRDRTNITKIGNFLRDNSQGMFLWVSLCIGELCEQNCDEDILHAMQHLPRSLAELFDSKVRRIQEGPKHIQALKLIQFCGVMRRPLTVEEFREALSISKHDKALNMAKIPNNINRIVRGCYGLIFIDEEEKTIHFIHQSVKDHLFYTKEKKSMKFDARSVDQHVGFLCMTYLNFANFGQQLARIEKDFMIPIQIQSSLASEKIPLANKIAQKLLVRKEVPSSMKFRDFQEMLESLGVYQSQGRYTDATEPFPFLVYARENWIFHVKDFCIDQESEMWALFCKCIEDRGLPLSRPWESLTPAELKRHKGLPTLYHSIDLDWSPFLFDMARSFGYSQNQGAWAFRETHFMLFRYLAKNPMPPHVPMERIHSFLPFGDGSSYRWAEILIELSTFDRYWGQALTNVVLDNGFSEQERFQLCLKLLQRMSAKDEDHCRLALGLALRRVFSTDHSFQCLLSINKAFYQGDSGVLNEDLGKYKEKSYFFELSEGHRVPLLIMAVLDMGGARLHEILQMGADVNVRDHLDRTALLEAAIRQNWNSVHILIDAHARLDDKNFEGETTFHMASREITGEVVCKLISAGADLDIRNSNGDTALHVSASLGYTDVVRHLAFSGLDLNEPNNQLDAALHIASRRGEIEIVRTLVSAGARLNITDSQSETPLHIATFRGHTKIVRFLVTAGHGGNSINLNSKNIKGETPLHIATAERKPVIMKVLIAAGADINLRNRKGETAFDIAKASRGTEEGKISSHIDNPLLKDGRDKPAPLHNAEDSEGADAVAILIAADGDLELMESMDFFKRQIGF
ncbi:hypothetical protein N7528_008910 [Penicillium herquei]|nr:hypothetical protein N7528_008910 [Penicillium herquei]